MLRRTFLKIAGVLALARLSTTPLALDEPIEYDPPPTCGLPLGFQTVPLHVLEHRPVTLTPFGQDYLDVLAKSMDERGLLNRITVDEDGLIIDGHCRYLAAKQLGWTHIDVRVLSISPTQLAECNAIRSVNSCYIG